MPSITQQEELNMIAFLEALPWTDLPLAESISLNPQNKWNQCAEIYSKFLDKSSYYEVNISYRAHEKIKKNYEQLLKLHTNMEKTPENDDDKRNTIMDENEWNRILSGLFDSGISDVVQNLNDSLRRFSFTDIFKTINA